MHTRKFPDLCNNFDFEYVPTVMGFRNGKEINRFVGVKKREEIKEFVKMLKESQ